MLPASLLLFILMMSTPHRTTASPNCCSLTNHDLTNLPPNPSCPLGTATDSHLTLIKKCQSCPHGTCRINQQCFCPTDFLNSPPQQHLCTASFAEPWPASIGLDDTFWRSCTRPTPSQISTFDNCCLLTTQSLHLRTGTSQFCPNFRERIHDSVAELDDGCGRCPFGTCRIGSHCYCPADFLRSDQQKQLCVESFGEVYPASIGRQDTLCPTNPVPEQPTSSPTSTPQPSQNSDATPTPRPTASGGAAPSPDKTKPGVSNAEGEEAAKEEPDKEKEDSEDGGLTRAEIAGIALGAISTFAAVLTVIQFWCNN